MKSTYKTLGIITAMVGLVAFGLNLNDCLMGHKPNLIDCLISVLFIVGCYCFSILNKSKKMTIALAIYSGLAALIGLATFIIGTYSLSVPILIPFALVILPPYYGLSLLVGADICGLIIFVLSAVVFVLNLCFCNTPIRKTGS